MSPLSFIPAAWLLWVRLAAWLLVVGLVFGAGWKVKGAFDGAEIADLKTQHAQAIADAMAKTLAAQRTADADHQALATDLAAMSATAHENLTRSEHAIDLLRPAVAAGTRVVRVAATCPAGAAGVPQAAAGGRVDPAAGPVLDSAAGETVLDLRAGITQTEHQLAACQQAVIRLTGQSRPASTNP